MNQILTALKYIFDLTPGQQFKYYLPLAILIGLLFLTSISFTIYYKKRKENDFAFKRIFKNTAKRFFWSGFLVLFLILTRYENIPYFSMRFLLLASLVLVGYFIYKTIYDYKVTYPKEHNNVKEKLSKANQSKSKYLPNKKKK